MLKFATEVGTEGNVWVAVFAEVHDAADGRHGVGRDFHEVHALVARQIDRVGEGHDSELLALVADDADFAGTDFPVDLYERGGRGGITRRERAAQDTLVG